MPTSPPTDVKAAPKAKPFPAIPRLEQGDRLTRDEFERRYEAMPDVHKAELIEGVVYMPSPVRLRLHGRPHTHVGCWLATYEAETPGVVTGDNSTVRMDLDNEPQPDVLMLIDPALGGQASISDDDYVEGAPELVAEVASSSVSYDVNVKLNVYRRNGVREYVVWRVLDGEIDWFVLRGGGYEKLQPNDDGILESEVFPGLRLDAASLVQGNLNEVLSVLREGLASEEHASFVERLQQAG